MGSGTVSVGDRLRSMVQVSTAGRGVAVADSGGGQAASRWRASDPNPRVEGRHAAAGS
jgi:hypothetical protein